MSHNDYQIIPFDMFNGELHLTKKNNKIRTDEKISNSI